MSGDGTGEARTAQLAQGLRTVRERLAAAAHAAGRDPGAVTLVVVTKETPAADLRRLLHLGVRDVGEARLPQLRDKHHDLGVAATELRWHAIGRIQRNKARATGRLADVVHSVDDIRLLDLLSAGAAERRDGTDAVGPGLECLVQVSLDGDPGRGGVPVAGVAALADAVAAMPGLLLRGVMAVAPLATPPEAAFARLAEVAAGVARDHPGADWISAGMSQDLEPAVAAGATHVRVGTAILGSRPPAR